MQRCVFCLRANQPMTREHIFAHWLVSKVHGARLVQSSSPLAGTPSPSEPTRIARLVAVVCAECNAGWMSGLEVGFRRMIFGRPRVGALQSQDRITLSRWSTKTAVLIANARGAALGDEAHRAKLLAGMPDDIEVFLARQRRPQQRLDFALDVMTDGRRARTVAILVDDVVAHVATRGTLASRHGTRLWPLRTHTLRWETLPVITSLLVRQVDDRSPKPRGLSAPIT